MYLTLTSVVFEFTIWAYKRFFIHHLTLTSVVFECVTICFRDVTL